ncbi:MAG: hypothetical protein GY788_18965, partial [bacterium]|nr:hypothetical protein [bacterium]
ALGLGAPALADELPTFTDDEFNDLFTNATLENLAPLEVPPAITGNASVDQRIREIGEARGYVRRPLPAGQLTSVSGYPMQPSAVAAWKELKAAASQAGHTLLLRSAYRSHGTQVHILLRRLTSYTDAAIEYRLRAVAVPGYSKHHTGYAIDITQPGYAFTSFKNSPAYSWLVADNYANAKRYGWIPSYPPNATLQGPLPEAWELTYVGMDNIWCYGFEASSKNPFCDDRNSVFEADIEWMVGAGLTTGCNQPLGDRFCPEDLVTRGELAAFLNRALRDSLSLVGEPITFADTVDSVFAEDIAWLSATGITNGCGEDSFCPTDPVTRGQLAAFLVRAYSYDDAGQGDLFIDDDDSIFEDQIERLATAGVTTGCNPPESNRYCPHDRVTRSQLAAFLRRSIE